MPHSIDRIWHGSGATFEIIQFRTEIWFDKAIEFDRVRRATRQWHGSFSKVPCRTKFIDHENIYMCKCFDSNAPDCDAFFMLNLARLN